MSRLRASTDCLDARLCLSCGYDGAELQGDKGVMTFACPACGSDLYARPARSYAEMEGFVEPAPYARPPLRARAIPPEDPFPWRRCSRLLARCVIGALALFGFATAVLSILAAVKPHG